MCPAMEQAQERQPAQEGQPAHVPPGAADQLQLSSFAPLTAAQRRPCPACGKPRRYWCYDCVQPLVERMPCLALPIAIDIVMHGEANSQATGTHAALLAPQHVTLWRHDDGTSHHRRQDALALMLPAWDPATTAVLFPEDSATPIVGPHGVLLDGPGARTGSGAGAAPGGEGGSGGARARPWPYQRVVVVEGNWVKARGLVARHPALSGLPRVQLPPSVRTAFWRRGEGSFRGALDEGVCTIEAVWHLVRLLDPGRCWDDLLWLFAFQRSMVQQGGSRRTRANLERLPLLPSGGQP